MHIIKHILLVVQEKRKSGSWEPLVGVDCQTVRLPLHRLGT